MIKNIPKKIYLQVEDKVGNFDDIAEVTWCTDKINKTDIEYSLLGTDFNIPKMMAKKKQLAKEVDMIFNKYRISQSDRSVLHKTIRGIGMLKLRLGK